MLTERAVDMADVCIFMMDARAGVLPADRVFAEILRKKSARVILVANKAEGNAGEVGFFDAFSLGLGEPVRLSGEHGEGMIDLQHVLMPIAKEFDEDKDILEPEIDIDIEDLDDDDTGLEITYSSDRPLQISIIGRPNAGKSTFLNSVSAARPKIGDYPFTTLRPNLGTVQIYDTSFIIADIPGLIEGASEGAGLGLNFLKHISRTGHLLILLDPQNSERSIEDQLTVLLNELKTYDPSLLEKSIWLAVNKKDTLEEEMQKEFIGLIKKKMSSLQLDYEGIVSISGFTGDETGTLLGMIANKMSETQD